MSAPFHRAAFDASRVVLGLVLGSVLAVAVALGCERDDWRDAVTDPSQRALHEKALGEKALGEKALGERLLDAAPRASAETQKEPTGQVARDLVEVRKRKISLGPSAYVERHIAFGSDCLVQLTPSALVVRDTKRFETLTELAVEGGRALSRLADGSVVALTAAGTLRVSRDEKQPARFARVTFLPGSRLLPDRRTPGRFFTSHRGSTLVYAYELAQTELLLLPVAQSFALESYTGGALGVLRDGSLFYEGEGGFYLKTPGGKERALVHERSLPRPVWRILPGRRVDQAWLVPEQGPAVLTQLTDRLRKMVALDLSEAVHDVASAGSRLAVVRIESSDAGGPRWKLLVLDGERTDERIEIPLGDAPISAADDWVQSATRDREVALSDDGRLVAVGGPTGVKVYALPSGELVFGR